MYNNMQYIQLVLLIVAFIVLDAVGALMLISFFPTLIRMIRAYRDMEKFQPVDVRVVRYHRDSDDRVCHIYVEQTDGAGPRTTHALYTKKSDSVFLEDVPMEHPFL